GGTAGSRRARASPAAAPTGRVLVGFAGPGPLPIPEPEPASLPPSASTWACPVPSGGPRPRCRGALLYRLRPAAEPPPPASAPGAGLFRSAAPGPAAGWPPATAGAERPGRNPAGPLRQGTLPELAGS